MKKNMSENASEMVYINEKDMVKIRINSVWKRKKLIEYELRMPYKEI